MGNFRVGAASVPVRLGAELFPNTESVGQHDGIYVRVIIFETDRRFAILSSDTPSIFPPDIVRYKRLLQDKAGVAEENCWVTATHNFSAPHSWPVGEDVREHYLHRLPPALRDSEEMTKKALAINEAFFDALSTAADEALASMKSASVGFGRGLCAINANRNMHTAEGWWQGVDMEGFVDRELSVVRFDDESGQPIAVIYNYSIQASCTAGPITDGGRLVSGDLTGASSLYIEREFPGCTALFLCGATNDQVPLYKINYCETDKNGMLRSGALGERGYILAEEQGRLLACAVICLTSKIHADAQPRITTSRVSYTCKCRKRCSDGRLNRPVHSLEFVSDGECELTAEVMLIGDIALVGLIPELDGITVAETRTASPFEKTLVATFVNGNGKSMPRSQAYHLCQYGLANSPFVEGSAEQTRDTALELLNKLRQ